jgi:formate dehydrogenase maturation protein FdhE
MSKPIKPLSDEQYVNKHDAAVCPVCLSSNIQSEPVDADGSIGTANIECHECGSRWTDIWKVTGYSDLNADMNLDQLGEVLEKAKQIRELTPAGK